MGIDGRRRREERKRKQKRTKGQLAQVPDEFAGIGFVQNRTQPDVPVMCRECDTRGWVGVEAAVVPDDVEVSSMGTFCSECGHLTEVTPRIEERPDGTRLGWIDREVITNHFDVLEYDTIEFEHVETGERVVLTEGSRHDFSWGLCNDCGLPFQFRGSQAVTVRTDSGIEPSMGLGPCEHCGGMGQAITSSSSVGEFTTTATVPGLASIAIQQIIEGLSNGTLDVASVVQTLRDTRDPSYTRFANWLEKRPVTAAVAATLLSTIMTITGPVITDRAFGPKDETAEIVDRILAHYDELHPVAPVAPEPPSPAAPVGPAPTTPTQTNH